MTLVLHSCTILKVLYLRCYFSGDFADLPSEVILMREISAGVPIKDPIAPAVIPV